MVALAVVLFSCRMISIMLIIFFVPSIYILHSPGHRSFGSANIILETDIFEKDFPTLEIFSLPG